MQVDCEIVDVAASSLTGHEATGMLERLDEYCATADNDDLFRTFARFRIALTKHIAAGICKARQKSIDEYFHATQSV